MNENTIRKLLKHTDLVAAVAVVVVVTMLIVPLPSMLLDLFITINISGALAIVVATMYLQKPLEFSAFPSLLLLTTMFRLAINVSVTRLILTKGNAGSVVHDFGQFVVGGNVVVGLVIFLILVVIQFVVVTNGAGRVAEVAARFTLDAMPGKQMAIDADLNAGLITDQEARHRRSGDRPRGRLLRRDGRCLEVRQGRRDGRGDHHRDQPARRHRRRHAPAPHRLRGGHPHLFDADGRRRPRRPDPGAADLGRDRHHGHPLGIRAATSARDLANQILRQKKAPLVAGCVICAFAAVPGLPKLPFLFIGGIMVAIGWSVRNGMPDEIAAAAAIAALPAPTEGDKPAAPREEVLKELPIDPLELGIGFGLVPLVDRRTGGSLVRRVSMIRRQIASELGMVIPPVRIHDEVDLDSHEYVVKVRGTVVARGTIMAGHHLAMDPGDAVGTVPGIPTTEPAFGLPAIWIPETQHAEAEALGYTVVDGESVIVTHLTETIRNHAAHLLTRQDVRQLLDQLKEINEAVVTEVVPDVLSLGEIQRVLQSLLSEGVSIRDLGAIVESVGDKARITRDPSLLAEYARQALGRAITAPHLDPMQHLARDHARPDDRAGAGDIDHPDQRRRVPGDGADAGPGRAHRRQGPVRPGFRAWRDPTGAALLGARTPPCPPPRRILSAAPPRLFLQRSRPRHQRRNHRSS